VLLADAQPAGPLSDLLRIPKADALFGGSKLALGSSAVDVQLYSELFF
jgi:hypothetical protein